MKTFNQFIKRAFFVLATLSLIVVAAKSANATPPQTVSEYHILKSNGGIGALFNRYKYMSHSRVPGAAADGGAAVFMWCEEPGWTRCKYTGFQRVCYPPEGITEDQWIAVHEAAMELNLQSEVLAREEEEYTGSDSNVMAMENEIGDIIYFIVTAKWEYSEEDPTTGNVHIRITMTDEYPPQ